MCGVCACARVYVRAAVETGKGGVGRTCRREWYVLWWVPRPGLRVGRRCASVQELALTRAKALQAQREAKARQQTTMAALKETDAHYKYAMQVPLS